jgi:hypothetical protein
VGQRLWYACESIGFAKLGATSYVAAHGVQSAGTNVRFNLEQIFELGQANIYEDVERAPEVELNVEKVLDGYPLLWHLATNGSTVGTLAGRSNTRCTVGISLFDDTSDSASGTPLRQIVSSGMYASQFSYDFSVNQPFRESLTLVGNDRVQGASLFTAPTFNNLDVPIAIAGSGGVNMREDLIIGEASGNVSRFPTNIEGVTSSGTIAMTNGVPSVYLQSIRVNANLGRDAINALGKKSACYRYVQFPVAVETTFEVLSKLGDGVNAAEEAENLTPQTIKIVAREGTTIDLGSSNKLLSCGTTLGNAQGGGNSNATTTYSYRTWSTCRISHPADPSGL